MNQPLFTVPLNAQVLVDAMRDAKPGDVFTYESLAKAIGGDDPRKVWLSVRRILRQEHDLIFDCIRSKGYQCLTPGQILDKGVGTRRRIRRISQFRANELRAVKPQELPETDRAKYHAEVAITGLVHASVSEDIRKQALQGKQLTISRGFSAEDLKERFGKKGGPVA